MSIVRAFVVTVDITITLLKWMINCRFNEFIIDLYGCCRRECNLLIFPDFH